ncbi:MAG TPA: VOC family protein [Actinomycetota bacterium]|nr:VOC family protein [Actinomycetota bacterium]
MTDQITYRHGEPIWQDHGSNEDAKAAEFYRALFGWDVPEGDQSMGGYRNCTLDGKMVAGITPQMSPGVPPTWSTYICVDDALAFEKLVIENGGKSLFPPLTIGEYGTMGFFFDPTGAAFGVWQPGTHEGTQARNAPGTVSWYELITNDVAASSKFYSAVFGWTAQSHGPAEGPGGYNEFKLGDKAVAGMMAKPPMMPADVPSHWAVYFAVDDTDAVAARARELGGKILMGPVDMPPGRFAAILDSTGAYFNILKSSRS